MGLISKNNLCTCSTLFLDISLPLFCTVTTWNFQKRFYGGNVVRVLVHFFFTGAQFLLTFVAASISHFITAATKFRYTFWVAIPINRVILHWYACGTDGRAYCHVITKFSRMGRFFFPMGLRSSLRARAPLKSSNYRKSGILGNRVIYL